ncbi:HigA family addiction module antitoxin [Lichenicoccus sp.]|uniref:HigA family addiction module antitoxin n=1 Tax=Lichenicoccus sp. TaxID=2781899 RepID=UPI003D0B3DD0
MNVPPNRVSQIINGKRAMTGDTALRLGHWFRTSAEFWLNLQTAYDLRLAAQVAGAEIEALPLRPDIKRSRAWFKEIRVHAWEDFSAWRKSVAFHRSRDVMHSSQVRKVLEHVSDECDAVEATSAVT